MLGPVGTRLGFVRAPKSVQHDSSLAKIRKNTKRHPRSEIPTVGIWERHFFHSEIPTGGIWEHLGTDARSEIPTGGIWEHHFFPSEIPTGGIWE